MQKYITRICRSGLRYLVAFISLMIAFNACVSKYFYTDKELKRHYDKKNFSPCYGTVLYKHKLVHYAQTGNDTMPIILFIHGGPGAWYGWMDYMDDDSLRNNYNMIAVDRLGYGKSEYGKPEVSVTEQTNAIKEIIRCFPENKKITLVGRSYGAPIAAMLARDFGKRVDRLVMISPVVHPEKEKFYWFSPLAKSKAINWMFPKMFNVATAEKYAHVNEMKKILPEWKKVTCPAVIMTGAKDWVADTSNFHIADTLLKNCCSKKLVWVKDEGHFITYHKKELVKKVITR